MKNIIINIVSLFAISISSFCAGGDGGGTRLNSHSLTHSMAGLENFRDSSINDFRYFLLEDGRKEVLIKDIKLYDTVAFPKPTNFEETMELINSPALESIQLTNGAILK